MTTTTDTQVAFAQNVADGIVSALFSDGTAATVTANDIGLTVTVTRADRTVTSPSYADHAIDCVTAYLHGLACDADGVSNLGGRMIATDGSMKTLGTYNTTDECMAFSDGHTHRAGFAA